LKRNFAAFLRLIVKRQFFPENRATLAFE